MVVNENGYEEMAARGGYAAGKGYTFTRFFYSYTLLEKVRYSTSILGN